MCVLLPYTSLRVTIQLGYYNGLKVGHQAANFVVMETQMCVTLPVLADYQYNFTKWGTVRRDGSRLTSLRGGYTRLMSTSNTKLDLAGKGIV